MADASTNGTVELLLAEYTFVTGLIRYYREVELRALAGTGLVLSGVAAVFGALEASDEPQQAAEAMLLAVAAWVPGLLLLIVLMAKARSMRGVLYVRDHLRPLAVDLTGEQRLLAWEVTASSILMRDLRRGPDARLWRVLARPVMGSAVVPGLLSGMPLIVMMLGTALALSAGAVVIDARLVTVLIAGAAALVATVLGVLSIGFTHATDRAYEDPRPRDVELAR